MLVRVDSDTPVFLTPRMVARYRREALEDWDLTNALKYATSRPGDLERDFADRALEAYLKKWYREGTADFEANVRTFALEPRQLHQEVFILLSDWCDYSGMGTAFTNIEPFDVTADKSKQRDHTVGIDYFTKWLEDAPVYTLRVLVSNIQSIGGTMDRFVIQCADGSRVVCKSEGCQVYLPGAMAS